MKDLEKIFGETGQSEGNARLFQTLWRGKWIILAFPLVFGAGARFYMKGLPPVWDGIVPEWQATAKVVIGYKDVNPLGGGGDGGGTKPTSLLNQQRAVIKSEPFLRQVAEDPELPELRHFKNSSQPFLAVLNDGLSATLNPKEDIVNVSFRSPFKRDAIAVVDKVVDTYLEFHRQKKAENLQQIIDLLNSDRGAKFSELEQIKNRITAIKRENPDLISTSGGGEQSLLSGKIEEANRALITAEAEVRTVQTDLDIIRALQAEDQDGFLRFGRESYDHSKDPVLQKQLDRLLTTLEAAQLDLATSKAPEGSQILNDKLKEIAWLEDKVDDIYREFAKSGLTEATNKLRAAEALRERHREAVAQLREEALRLEGAQDELKHQEQVRTAILAAVEELNQRVDVLGLSAETGALNLYILDKARPTPEPVYPDPTKFYGISLALGLALGMGLVLLRGQMDRRIWTVEEVPDLLGTSVLAVFPRMPGGRRRARIGRVVEEDQGSLAAEAIRSVRTATTFGLPDEGKGVVLVSSSVSGEGKSVTASNLALALAQADRRTILVDCDLRKPNQNEIFNVVDKRGVGDVLTGSSTLHKAIIRNVAKGLDLLTAGDSGGRAAELIESPACRDLLMHLSEQYDCVIVDSSPVLETSEARVLAALADLVIFVLRLDVSSRPNAVRARDILRGVDANLLGVMLNGSRMGRDAKSYAGGIAYGGAYGNAYGRSYGARGGEGKSRVATAEKSDGLEAWS